jgi:hypothetical protein
MLKQAMRLVLLPAAVAVLVACGGGSTASNTVLDGTVAMGAPISGARVQARDVNGNTSNVVYANEDGKYSGLNLTGLVAPIVIEARGQVGQTPYTLYTPLVAASSGTANVTTLTTALTGALAGGDPSAISLSAVTTSALQQAKTLITSALAPIASAIGVNLNSTDMVQSAFDANSTGIDKLMDLVDIRVRPEGISMANKLEAINESTGADRSELRITTSGQVTGTLTAASDISLSWQQQLATQMTACFALPASQRITYSDDAGGVPIPSAIHSSCSAFVASNYKNNSFTFGERWAYALKDSNFNNAKFRIQLAYVVNDGSSTFYVANIYFADQQGNGYTRPEVVADTGGGVYKLRGNQRDIDVLVQPQISKVSDVGSPNSGSNLVAGRLTFFFTPHRDYDSGSASNKYFYTSNKPQPRWVCSWVTGPALPGYDPLATTPKGGILLKVPRSDYVSQRNYMAVHVKFPANFDPTGSQADRNQLVKACAARENVGTNSSPSWEAASWNTANFYTIDAAKTHQESTFAWPSTANYSWAGDSTNWGDAQGTGGGNWAPTAVSQITKNNYKPTNMPTYTFYSFKVSNLPTSVYTGSIPVVDDEDGNDFFASKVVTKTRMLGAMPYLSSDANGVYNGNTRFGSIGNLSFLTAGAADISAGGSISTTWSPAPGGTGMDRVGLSCWANWQSSTGKKRWGPSVSSASFPVPRSDTTGAFVLDDGCVGLGPRPLFGNEPNTTNASTMYRDIWVRTYDQENRQIQRVYLTEIAPTTTP